MSNMSYVRFENTYSDLQDCYQSFDGELSESEQDYRAKLVELCSRINNEYGDLRNDRFPIFKQPKLALIIAKKKGGGDERKRATTQTR